MVAARWRVHGHPLTHPRTDQRLGQRRLQRDPLGSQGRLDRMDQPDTRDPGRVFTGPGELHHDQVPQLHGRRVGLRDRDAAGHVQGGLECVQLHQCPLQVASCCSVVGAVHDRSAQRGNTVFPQPRCPVLEQGPTIQGQHGPRGWGCRGGNDLSGGAHRRMTSLLRGRQGYGVWAAVSPRCPGTRNRATPAAGHVRLPSVAGVRKPRQSTDTAAGPPSRVTHRLRQVPPVRNLRAVAGARQHASA